MGSSKSGPLERERLEGNHEAVRERVRTFAETEQKVFLGLSLALYDHIEELRRNPVE